MALLDVQTVLARLYTDSAFRARFFNDPGASCQDVALTEAEQRQLAALNQSEVERFARSLKQKRLKLVRELLPATVGVMRDRFAQCFFDYCDAQPSASEPVHEATAFAEFLSTLEMTGPLYWRDLIRCERLRLQVLHAPSPPSPGRPPLPSTMTLDHRPRLRPQACVAAFDYDMETLYPLAARGGPVDAQPDACVVLIGKVRGALRVKLKRINATTARLLSLCDGARTLRAMVDGLADDLGLSDSDRQRFAADCVAFLASLEKSRLVDLLVSTHLSTREAGGRV